MFIYKGGDVVHKQPGDFSDPTNKDIMAAKRRITMLINKTQGVAEGSEQQYAVTIDAINHGVLAPVTVVAGSSEEAKQKAIAGVKASMIKRGYELMVRSVSAKPEQGVAENMDHSKDGRAVEELKAALIDRKQRLQSASDDQVYDSIDKIMTRIAKTHSISGQKLHDLWVDRYKQVPDTWIMNEDASGIDFDMQFDDDTGSFATVTARAQGRTLGSVKFFMDGDTLEADMVEVDDRYRGQGIAAAMYDYAKSQGYTIEKSSNLTPDGDHFWNKNRGEETVWEQGMAENFADGKNPGRKGLAKRVGVNCKQPVAKLRSIAANSSGERQRMAHWCANMKSGKKK
jgi:predicted GNAT family acetyltransferase